MNKNEVQVTPVGELTMVSELYGYPDPKLLCLFAGPNDECLVLKWCDVGKSTEGDLWCWMRLGPRHVLDMLEGKITLYRMEKLALRYTTARYTCSGWVVVDANAPGFPDGCGAMESCGPWDEILDNIAEVKLRLMGMT